MRYGTFVKLLAATPLAILMLLPLLSATCAQQPPQSAAEVVSDALKRETEVRSQGDHIAYTSHERSTRTKHQLWEENVVEIEQGELRRLISIDGLEAKRQLLRSSIAIETKKQRPRKNQRVYDQES